MKKCLLLFFLVLTTASFSQQTLFVDKNYDQALAQAKSEHKPLVLLFYATWCPHCNKMKKEVFTETSVIDFYSKNFICMSADSESDYGKELKTRFQNKFRVNSFPTFVFLDTNENLLYCNSGEFDKAKFLEEGTNVLLPENQLPNIKTTYNADPKNPDKCLKYIVNLRKAGIDATPIAQKFLSGLTPDEKLTDINWRVFSNGVSNFDTDEFKYVVTNREAFAKAISPSRVEKKINYTISETLKPFVDKVDTLNYEKKRQIAEGFHNRKIDSIVYRYDLLIVSQTTNWKKYQKITTDNVAKFSLNDPVTLYDICNTYFETVKDKKGLQQAVEWSKTLLAKGENMERYILISKLLTKLKDYKQALVYAEKGKALANSLGLKNEEMNTVLADIKKHNQ